MSIKIEHVSHLYGEGEAFEKKALDDVTLEIPDGQFLGVIGHTGSGKSTLIQHLNGLLKATSGTIYYNNEDIFGIEKCHKINEEYRKQEEISTWQRSVKICL